MAPIITTTASPQKRPLTMADYDAHPPKKQRQFYHRHHTLQFKQQSLAGTEPALVAQLPLLDEEEHSLEDGGPKPVGRSEIDEFLDHSIISVCQQVALREGFASSSIDSWALETFRGHVEECMRACDVEQATLDPWLTQREDILNLCKYIRRPMLAARRTAPTATDFESAFQAAQVSTPEDQLPPRIRRKPTSPPSLLPTPPPDEFFNTHELPESILGANLNPKQEKRRDPHIPSTFPAFPSQHTFRDTPVLPPRERDPRRIRELATEEGRLGEQALRKLAGAAKGEVKLDLSIEAVDVPVDAQRQRRRKKVETMEGLFEETMKELAKTEKDIGMRDTAQDTGFEMAPIVNSERKFWMPDTSRRKAGRPDTSHITAKTGANHHALSEKARGKQKASDQPAQPADGGFEMQLS